MSLHDRFANEADFRDQFVRPLLNRMGFFLVTEMHGTREFGADFLFSELHRFGHTRHLAAQVKHEKTINSGAIIDTLVSQINQAFAHAFTLPDSPRELHVSAVYLFNSGRITDAAKDDLQARLRRSEHGDNVYFLDGERLETLNAWGSYYQDQQLRQRLTGLRDQIVLNIHTWGSIRDWADGKRSARESCPALLSAIEQYLIEPTFENRIRYVDVLTLWRAAAQIETIHRSLTMGGVMSVEARKTNCEVLSKACAETISLGKKIKENISGVLGQLKPL